MVYLNLHYIFVCCIPAWSPIYRLAENSGFVKHISLVSCFATLGMMFYCTCIITISSKIMEILKLLMIHWLYSRNVVITESPLNWWICIWYKQWIGKCWKLKITWVSRNYEQCINFSIYIACWLWWDIIYSKGMLIYWQQVE